MKKSAAMLVLITVIGAVPARGQVSSATATNAPLSRIQSTMTATPVPRTSMSTTQTPTVGPKPDSRVSPTTPAGKRQTAPRGGMVSSPSATPREEVSVPVVRDNYVALNFTNVDVGALVKVMSQLTHKNFILDERVTGKVTIMTPTKITPEEAYQVFLSALEIKGFTAVEEGRVTRIIQTNAARQSGLKVYVDNNMRGEGFVTKLMRMSYVNPQEIVRTITPLMTKDGSIIAYMPTNSVIMTDSVPNIKKIERLIQVLDVPPTEGKGKINVFYLKYANAEDIAKIMQGLVSRLPGAQPGGPQPIGASTILEGAVTVTADKATNSLIIVGSPGDYETVKDVIQKLDIRRRQVYVEAAIIEMSLNKSLDIGFEFQYTDKSINSTTTNKVTPLGGTNFGNLGSVITGGPAGLAALNGLVVAAVKGAFTYNGVQFLNVGALLHALQANGDVNVLSTPNLLTTDNQKAEIMVGSNIPFVTGQTQNAATGGTAILTSIDRKDVGITLRLTPQITSDDNVRLDIYQEISDIIDTPGLNPNVVGPSTSKRSASTTVLVKDRQTMVIGGLIRDNVKSSSSAVPFLGNIPVLGWLFKTKNSSVDKTNLMIFITPHIIKNELDAEDMTERKNEHQEHFREKYNIKKKDPSELPKMERVHETSDIKTEEMTQNTPMTGNAIQSLPSNTLDQNGKPLTAPTRTYPAEAPR